MHKLATPANHSHVEKLREELIRAIAAALSERNPLEALAQLMLKDEGMSLDICAPGNHGGSGDDAGKWLVTLMPSDHRNIREFFGKTLAEAINYATL